MHNFQRKRLLNRFLSQKQNYKFWRQNLTPFMMSQGKTKRPKQHQQEAISQKEIVFRFRKDIQSEKGWRFDILCMGSLGVKGICADALLCDSLSCQESKACRRGEI